ncbi:Docking protein [Schistosoma japonicum]|nr:Docking protein [Schistosoma japonicum]
MGLVNSVNKSDDLQRLFDKTETRVKMSHHPCGSLKSFVQFLQSINESIFYKKKWISCFSASLLNCNFKEIRQGLLIVRTYDIKFQYVHNDRIVVLLWPLHGLRWYGRNRSLFLFESGSRCKLGPGLFVFKCKHPQKLIACLEKRINSLSYLYHNTTFITKSLHQLHDSHLNQGIAYSSSKSPHTIESISCSRPISAPHEESHSSKSLQPSSSVIFCCGPDNYLIPRKISEEVSLVSDFSAQMHDSRLESSACSPMYLNLPSDNYLEPAPASELPICTTRKNNDNNTELGSYVVALPSNPNGINNRISMNVMLNSFRTTNCSNNIYVPQLV